MKQHKSRNAKDWTVYWRGKYQERFKGQTFMINWMKDGATMRRLMGHMSDKKLHRLIDFAFSDHPATSYLRAQGYPIALLPSMINKYMPIIDNPGVDKPVWELKPEIPVWDDERTSYLWRCIKESDMASLLKHIKDAEPWHILMGKLQTQQGFVPEKVTWFFERWRMRESINRIEVK